MTNILYEPFPDSVSIHGKDYAILTDFREWLRFSDLYADSEISTEEKALLMAAWLNEPPAVIDGAAIDALLGFLRAGTLDPDPPEQDEDDEPQEPEPPHPPHFDFTIDARYVLGDFRHYYGIDLLRIEYLHWWEFLSLLRALPDESTVMRRISIRSTDLSQVKNKAQRALIAKQQRAIAIPYAYDDEMIGAVLWNA